MEVRAARRTSVILAPALCTGLAVAGGCKIAKIAELPVTMIDMHPMVTAQINAWTRRSSPTAVRSTAC